jgi:FtsZ-binding cell division protein ZapB
MQSDNKFSFDLSVKVKTRQDLIEFLQILLKSFELAIPNKSDGIEMLKSKNNAFFAYTFTEDEQRDKKDLITTMRVLKEAETWFQEKIKKS